MLLIDSHCHLDLLDLGPYQGDFGQFMAAARRQLRHMLCVAVDLASYPAMSALVADHPDISLSVGVHPNASCGPEPGVDELLALAANPKVIAIGETGLDYFRGDGGMDWQQQRFRTHIRAAKIARKPLIIHTRAARDHTLRLLDEEGAAEVGGVIHCFTEDWAFAEQALALGFYISFSGIVTFKNAHAIQAVAQQVPADRFLIETDAPYLAPAPHRGKPNYPMYVRHVADHIAALREVPVAQVARQSSANFCRLFGLDL